MYSVLIEVPRMAYKRQLEVTFVYITVTHCYIKMLVKFKCCVNMYVLKGGKKRNKPFNSSLKI